MITMAFLGVVVIAIVLILTISDNKKKNRIDPIQNETPATKILNKLGCVFNILLSILYTPLSWFSWLLMMASEATIGATNPTFIILINIFCWITMSIPFLCFLGIFLSVLFRKKGYSIWSFVVQFIPLTVFGMNLLLLSIAERLPATI